MSDKKLIYVNEFKYLGHFITNNCRDDIDILKEVRSLYSRGNTIIRKFHYCTLDVKCSLFQTYCYSLYGGALWASFNNYNMKRLNVCYNNIMRRLVGVPPWESARTMFVALGVKSFGEVRRNLAYSLMSRVGKTENYCIRVSNIYII